MTDADLDTVRAVYAECVAKLREGESYAKPLPSSLDVRIALTRRAIVCGRGDAIAVCTLLALPLADAP